MEIERWRRPIGGGEDKDHALDLWRLGALPSRGTKRATRRIYRTCQLGSGWTEREKAAGARDKVEVAQSDGNVRHDGRWRFLPARTLVHARTQELAKAPDRFSLKLARTPSKRSNEHAAQHTHDTTGHEAVLLADADEAAALLLLESEAAPDTAVVTQGNKAPPRRSHAGPPWRGGGREGLRDGRKERHRHE